jgi:hypothetical protein
MLERRFSGEYDIPLDLEACDTGLLGQDLSLHLLNDGLRRRLHGQRLVCVFVVHIVAHANELTAIVAAAKQDDCDANDLAVGDARQVWGVGAEGELVDACGGGANKDRVELLVVFVSVAG